MESTLTGSINPQSLCRFCSQNTIKSFLNLGDMHLTGYFPDIDIEIPKKPLNLGKCESCGLVQLVDRSSSSELYGKEYGYESNLNSSMKDHLQKTAQYLEKRFNLTQNDHVLDIASNDGTLLSGYSTVKEITGIDPIIDYLNNHYPESSIKISSFFSAKAVQ